MDGCVSKRWQGERQQRGQTMVEFALLLPLLMLIIIGMMDLGRAIWSYNLVAHAAREGARAGIFPGESDFDIVRAVQRAASPLVIPDSDIQRTNPRYPGGTVTVRVTYRYEPITPLVGQFIPRGWLQLTSQSTMRVEF